jgi:hypothetical protein
MSPERVTAEAGPPPRAALQREHDGVLQLAGPVPSRLRYGARDPRGSGYGARDLRGSVRARSLVVAEEQLLSFSKQTKLLYSMRL